VAGLDLGTIQTCVAVSASMTQQPTVVENHEV
jgi:molecular chaperone DnaK (HSP70)